MRNKKNWRWFYIFCHTLPKSPRKNINKKTMSVQINSLLESIGPLPLLDPTFDIESILLYILYCTLLNISYILNMVNTYIALYSTGYCICFMTRGGIYGKIQPEHKGNPEGKAQGISQGLTLYFTVYPDSSHNTDILNFLKLYFQYCSSWQGNIGRVDSPYRFSSWLYLSRVAQQIQQYRSVQTQQGTLLWQPQEIHIVRRAILELLNFSIILFSNRECSLLQCVLNCTVLQMILERWLYWIVLYCIVHFSVLKCVLNCTVLQMILESWLYWIVLYCEVFTNPTESSIRPRSINIS